LGKGLDALFGGAAPAAVTPAAPVEEVPSGDQVLHLDPREIRPNPRQPRHSFSEEPLEELAESIRRDGVQEPVLVRLRDGAYELISGERRVRASIMADQETVPAICRDVSDNDMLRLGLIENIQREDLNPVELALAYQQLVDEFDWTQEQLSDQVGKKRATVANSLRLLQLPEDVLQCLADDLISMGHARALLALESAEKQSALCKRIVAENLSVRQVEHLASGGKPKKKKPERDPDILAMEERLRKRLGTKVMVRANGPGKGRIEIEYYNLDDLDRILEIMRALS